MTFSHGSDFSRLFLHTANICVQRQDTLIGAFCATKSTRGHAPTVVVSGLCFLTELHTFIERFITYAQLRQTSFVMIFSAIFPTN